VETKHNAYWIAEGKRDVWLLLPWSLSMHFKKHWSMYGAIGLKLKKAFYEKMQNNDLA